MLNVETAAFCLVQTISAAKQRVRTQKHKPCKYGVTQAAKGGPFVNARSTFRL
jgi:hypothetical protein